jgi:hypothetical protein
MMVRFFFACHHHFCNFPPILFSKSILVRFKFVSLDHSTSHYTYFACPIPHNALIHHKWTIHSSTRRKHWLWSQKNKQYPHGRSTMQYPHCVDKPSLFLQYNTCTITSSKKCIAIFAYNCIVYLHQRPPLVHDTILICKYCFNLLLHHPRLLKPHMIHQMQYQHSFIQNHWCFFVFHPTCKNCKDLIFFSFKFHNRCPYHHDPIWSYYENLVHCLLSSLYIMIGPMYAILAWMWFHVFP